MNMIRNGQVKGADTVDVMEQLSFVNEIFGVATVFASQKKTIQRNRVLCGRGGVYTALPL